MPKKRVHEIAKAQGLSSKDVLSKLQAAGIEAKAAASSVEEADALKAIGAANGGGGTAQAEKPAPKPRQKPAQAAGQARRRSQARPRRAPQHPPPAAAARSAAAS